MTEDTRASRSTVRSRLATAMAVALLSTHALLLGWIASCHSPVFNEAGHLASGLYHLQSGRFDLFRVNPPLPRTIAALPLVLSGCKFDWHFVEPDPLGRYEYRVGSTFLRENETHALRYVTWGRWSCIALSLLGGYFCWRWSTSLFCTASGLVALALWCFSPYVLGHASLITADAASAAVGLTGLYAFRTWLVSPSWWHASIAGIALGLALLTKFTLLVFFPVILLCWIAHRLQPANSDNKTPLRRELAMLAWMAVLSLYIINVGYNFRGTFTTLGAYAFQSETLGGAREESVGWNRIGNRFSGTWLHRLPVPVPEDYVLGVDIQRSDFERGKYSYLDGEWRQGGWWYFYLHALAIKVPLGTWLLLLVAISLAVSYRSYRVSVADELCLLLPAAAILVLVSSQTGFSIHSRYVLPMLPFVFVSISRVGKALGDGSRHVRYVTVGALIWIILSSLYCVPHALSYFNEVVGGPRNGHRHLLDSNVAWNQDLLYLKSWYDAHPEAAPIQIATIGMADPAMFGIEFSLPPMGPKNAGSADIEMTRELGPRPGWFAVDVNHLHGTRYGAPDGHWSTRRLADDSHDLTYLQRFRPVDTVGYSILIFHITPEEANRVRRQLGLPELGTGEPEGGASNIVPTVRELRETRPEGSQR